MPLLPTRAHVAAAALAAGVALAPATAAHAAGSSSGYTIQVRNSGAGGDPGYFYVGGPLNITVKPRHGSSNAKVTIWVTPDPIDRKGPFHTRVGRTYSSLAPSRAGRTTIRARVGDTVLRRTIRVRTAR